MIRSERYGGGHRWSCDNCDRSDGKIQWWNSYPPPHCRRCSGNNDASKRAAAVEAIKYLKDRYQERAYFPGSIRAIADLCEKHNIIPNGIKKTHFAKLINEVAIEQKEEYV